MTAHAPAAGAAKSSTTWRGVPVMVAIALIGLAIASYLTVTKLAGGSPICGPLQGCETVDASPYSTILGIPTAAFGLVYSLTLIAATLVWWRSRDRRFLLAAYALSLVGVVMEGYFVYLQVAVIHAVCVWCAGYGLTVVAGFVANIIALRRASAA
ncbi:MAG TPA: vitamin K epoxide reductase family protein [Candidatus Sulfotelmatobacter sp.]|nr:vitamin K epoxide reductase family protein [Candidatus Sulfotelmatobacter sp.]